MVQVHQRALSLSSGESAPTTLSGDDRMPRGIEISDLTDDLVDAAVSERVAWVREVEPQKAPASAPIKSTWRAIRDSWLRRKHRR
jgi:hypothetical protein